MMNSEQWKKNIVKACKDAGTYQPFFDEVINTLAQIIEKRDEAYDLYQSTRSKPVISMTKGGASKPCKNPILAVWCDLNSQALAYWRELGLTPSGLRNLGKDISQKKQSTLQSILGEIKS